MPRALSDGLSALLLTVTILLPLPANAVFDRYFSTYDSYSWYHSYMKTRELPIELGERPAYLIKDMDKGPLQTQLQSCRKGPFQRSDFSIGHRGAPLKYPEHTKQSYIAAARMGAGILECDVTFTKDKALVCRHSQCDLHSTTNILQTPLAEKCSTPFTPAEYAADGQLLRSASAQCCTSDITLAEFKTLHGRMDNANTGATSIADYLQGAKQPPGTLLSHAESITLFKKLGVKMTPELKAPAVPMPFAGFTQQDYAQALINEYKAAGIAADQVFAQSFNRQDLLYWIEKEPDFGRQAVFLDGRYELAGFDHRDASTWSPGMDELVAQGVKIIAPPLWKLLEAENGSIVPSAYALAARTAGLKIIAWTLERSGPLQDGGGWYFQTLNGSKPKATAPEPGVIAKDGDVMQVLHVLARDVGVSGVFSDWPATTSYYANCMGL